MTALKLAVLVVALPGDVHADKVAERLDAHGVVWMRTSLNALEFDRLLWSPTEGCLLRTADAEGLIRDYTTVWWRRPGWFTPPCLSGPELLLAQDEARVLFPGALVASSPRWVDHPSAIGAATKPVQLTAASELGLNVPATIITNDPAQASAFLQQGPTIAKCVSSGPGLAPFVSTVPPDLSHLVEAAPVMLQRLIQAGSDLRVVTIGKDVFVWRCRRLANDPPDWRQVDPGGRDFERVQISHMVEPSARAIARALALNFSVQDWLEVDHEVVFLEVNPQGQWLFLDSAADTIAPALAHFLATGTR